MIKVKARPTAEDLPSGYQFGDAAPICCCENPYCSGKHRMSGRPFTMPIWRAPHANAADRLARVHEASDVEGHPV